MNLAELTQFIKGLSGINELTFTLIIMFIYFTRFLIKKPTQKSDGQSSIELQDIKFKGPAIIATLIILINYFRQDKK